MIRNEKQYDYMVSFLDFLIDTVGKNEKHPLAALLDLVGVLIEDYEERHIKQPKGDPISVLKLLMKEHGLTQANLRELGTQGIVSEILSGKRSLNLKQVKALSKRFHISPTVFIEEI